MSRGEADVLGEPRLRHPGVGAQLADAPTNGADEALGVADDHPTRVLRGVRLENVIVMLLSIARSRDAASEFRRDSMFKPNTTITLAFLAMSAACGGVTRVVSVSGYAPEEISMSVEEGALVDQLVAAEPKGEAQAKCDFWKKKLSEIPPSKTGAVQYAQKRGGGLCGSSGR